MSRPTYNGMNVDEYARHYVKREAERFTLADMVYGQHGQYGGGLYHQIGGSFMPRGTDEFIDLKSDQLVVQIGDEWKVFDLKKIYKEVTADAQQASLF